MKQQTGYRDWGLEDNAQQSVAGGIGLFNGAAHGDNHGMRERGQPDVNIRCAAGQRGWCCKWDSGGREGADEPLLSDANRNRSVLGGDRNIAV